MLRLCRPLAVLPLLLCLAALPARAEGERTILVLDASGSMWGQIDGEAKITIAQRVIGELLDTLPPEIELGLTAYGHNRKGDCTDIETLVEAGPATREQIRAAVAGIRPKGKTPLSDAVVAAARALRYEEEAATVILVSDGRETCERDPCAVGRALEEAGIGFTAHVIGFDVAEEDDRAQLRCLAENTGGRFLGASNAGELAEALVELSAPPAPPATVDVVIAATEGDGGERITQGLVWSLTSEAGSRVILGDFSGAEIRMSLPPGEYRAEVLRTDDEATAERSFELAAGTGPQTILLALVSALPEATLTAPDSAPAGSTIQVDWTGPDARNDHISTAARDSADGAYATYAYTRAGNPLELRMPPDAGEYEIRYVLSDGRKVLARRPITATPVEATVTAPVTAPAGATVAIDWTGPAYPNDFIAAAPPESDGGSYATYAYVREGSPLELVMPPEAGEYEIRYIQSQGNRILARAPVTVTPVGATLTAPAAAAAGATVQVQWTGPDYRNDYIAVARPDARGSSYENYTYTREGSPLGLVMPPEPGDYEIRYIQTQGSEILARQPITVTEVGASLTAPAESEAGATVVVEWTGPDYRNDYIAVARPDARGSSYENYTYTREGSPLRLVMPPEPGDYEIRYVQNQGGKILARQSVSVSAVTAAVSAPAEALQGGVVLVQWQGPDYRNDYISVARPGDRGSRYESYSYTREGNPLRLTMPADPGEYEIRYVQNQGGVVLASRTITVRPAEAELEAPGQAPAGSAVIVNWTGPDNRNDYISIARPDDKGSRYEHYSYTREGSPLRLETPARPGSYEIRYIQNVGGRIIARRPIEIGPAE